MAVVALSTLSLRASAETRSWAAIKSKLPATTSVVVGVDVAALRGAPSFPKLLTAAFAESNDVKQALDLIKGVCAIDVLAAVSDVTIAADIKSEQGVIALGVEGVDEGKLVACATKVLQQQDPKAKLVTKRGKVTEYALGRDKVYAAWLAKDVVVISTNLEKRASLDALLSGKPPAGDLAAMLGKTGTSALAWGAVSMKQDGVIGGYGTLALAKGTVSIAVKLLTATPDVTSKLTREAKDELAQTITRAKQAPAVMKVLQAVKVAGTGTEIAIEVSVSEAELPTLLPAFDKLF
jgi:hypothetical protein